jgi:aminoglycoside 3-N-acetyltransferase
MRISKMLFFLFPKHTFLKIRYLFFIYRQKLYRPFTEKKFRELLVNKLGVKKGTMLFIHSSMDFLNYKVSPEIILEILLDLVGEDGTLIFPAWHFSYRAEVYLQRDKIFDVKRSPTVLGLLPETARRHPNALRSVHPTTSIVAIGKYAKELIQDHEKSIYPCGEMSPFYKMMNYNAIIVGLGVNSNFLSFMHCPEDILREKFPIQTRTTQVFDAKVRNYDGTVISVKTLAAHNNIRIRDFAGFSKKYLSKDVFFDCQIGGSDFFRADSTKLFIRVVELAEKGITMYNS